MDRDEALRYYVRRRTARRRKARSMAFAHPVRALDVALDVEMKIKVGAVIST